MTAQPRSIRAQLPWQHRPADGDDPRERPAPRQAAPYLCERRGCQFTVPFLAGIAPPAEWDCRCGGTARYAGEALTSARTVTGPAVRRLEELAGHEYTLLHKRRSRHELEELLTQKMSAPRKTRGRTPT